MTRLLDDAQTTFLRAGVTTVVDAQVSRREMETYLAAQAGGDLRLRVEMLVLSSLLDEVLRLGVIRRFGDDQLAIAGIKLYADGALGAGTAWFPGGYAGHPEQHGQLYHEPAAYAAMVRRAHVGRAADGHPRAVTRRHRHRPRCHRRGATVGATVRPAPPHRALRSAHR